MTVVFAQLTLILLLHYLVKFRSRSLAVYNNKCMHRLGYCFKMVFTADNKQLINSLRQLKSYSSRRFLKEFLQKKLDVQRTWLLAFKHWRIWDCGKSSKQWATAHCMYVWQHDVKADTISVKQVTTFNDFVDSQWFSEPTHALPSMNSLLQTAKLRLLDFTR